jgi:hypothetical protein
MGKFTDDVPLRAEGSVQPPERPNAHPQAQGGESRG